jgi:hypothetical protein
MDLAVHVGLGETEGSRVEVGMLGARLQVQGIEAGFQMAAHAIGADQHHGAEGIAGGALQVLRARAADRHGLVILPVAIAIAVFAHDLDRAFARGPGCAADVVEDGLALVLELGKELPPGWIDRFRVIQIPGVEFLDERCVGTGEEGRRIGAHASLAAGTAIGRRPINATGSSKQVRPCPIAANPDPLPVYPPTAPSPSA